MRDCSLSRLIVLPAVPNISVIRSSLLCLASVGSHRWIRFVCLGSEEKLGSCFGFSCFFISKKGRVLLGYSDNLSEKEMSWLS